MDLVFASHRYAPVPGGTERIAQLIAEGAAARGHRATMVTQREPGVPDEETRNGVRVVRLRMRRVAGIRIPVGYTATLRALGGDLFHLHGNRIWCADWYFPAARRFAWPSVLTGHGFYQYAVRPRWWDRYYFERYLPRALRRFDAYACLTEYERGQLRGWGVPDRSLALVPNGIEVEEFTTARPNVAEVRAGWGLNAPLAAVYVGGFFENKRVDRLIDAIAPRRSTWGLVAVGRDLPGGRYDAASCTAKARTLGVELRALGELDRPSTVAAILSADVVVLGSDYEGFGVVLAEAMAAGRPFVATAAGAAPELAATGGGVAVAGVPAFTDALASLEETSARERMGAAGRAASGNWTTARMVERYLALYERILADRRGRGG